LQEAFWISDEITVNRSTTTPKWGQYLEDRKRDGRYGTVSEFAIRQAFNMATWDRNTYPPFESRTDADVGLNAEIRSTTYENGKLLLHKGHDDVTPRRGRDFILTVLNHDWSVRIAGWISMYEAQELWLPFNPNGNRPCMFVGQNFLYDIEELSIIEGGEWYKVNNA